MALMTALNLADKTALEMGMTHHIRFEDGTMGVYVKGVDDIGPTVRAMAPGSRFCVTPIADIDRLRARIEAI